MIPLSRAYEIIQTDILELGEAHEAVQWRLAELYTEALTVVTAAQLAADVGKSAATIRRYVRVLRLWPDPADRQAPPPITWSHFVLASETPDPRRWLGEALDHEWSTRDLRDAIQQHAAADPVEAEQTAWDRALQRVRKLVEASDATTKPTRLAQLWGIGR